MSIKRKKTKVIKVGNVIIGGDNPIIVQSMTNTPTSNISKTVSQIKKLEKAGCEIVRVSTPDEESCLSLKKIKDKVNIPIIADIHFNYKLAILAIENGADGIRINPGNIGSKNRIKKIVDCAKLHNIPIRVGVNSGSIKNDILKKYNGPTVDALVESCVENVKMIEDMNFYNIKISLKSSDVLVTIEAYKRISEIFDYPLHIGITEAGTLKSGTIKSSVGLGILLYLGIGDTIRVSLTGDPVEEVYVAYKILDSLNIRKRGIEIISCPTCARTEIPVIKLAEKIEKKLKYIKKHIKIAVMGCIVNGPGEAKEADIGLAGSKKYGVIFEKGKIIQRVPFEKLEKEFFDYLDVYLKNA